LPSIKFPYSFSEDEVAELKAHHLACGQLVRGCQDAIFRFRSRTHDDTHGDEVAHRVIEIMEETLDSWCETLSILRSSLQRDSSREEPYGINVRERGRAVGEDGAQTITRFARSVFASTQEREHAGS
jgi:hypothetical protein